MSAATASPPSVAPCDATRVPIGHRMGATGANPGAQPIRARLSKERQRKGLGAAGEEALAYVGAGAEAGGREKEGGGARGDWVVPARPLT